MVSLPWRVGACAAQGDVGKHQLEGGERISENSTRNTRAILSARR
jgi:hypothetical protein